MPTTLAAAEITNKRNSKFQKMSVNKIVNDETKKLLTAENEAEIKPFAVNTLLGELAKALMHLANRVPVSNNPAQVNKAGNTINVTHGQVNFNSGDTGRAVRKSFTGYGRDSIMAAMKFTGLGIPLHHGTIDISLNNVMQSSKAVTSGEYVQLTIHGSMGVKRKVDIDFGTTSRSKSPWQPYFHYSLYHDDGGNSPRSSASNYTISNGKIYVKNTENIENNMTINKEYYTMNELFLEFYDEVQESRTDQAKTLAAKDKV